MPPAGASKSAGVQDAAASEKAPHSAGRRDRRRRFRRFVWIAHAVTGVAHLAPIAAASLFVDWPLAAVFGALVFALTAFRLQGLVHEGRRSRLVVLLIDQPVLVHWCASVAATLLWPVLGVLSLVSGLLGAHDAGVLRALGAAALASYAIGASLAGWGTWVRRRWVRITRVEIPIVGLAPELDGYRIAQVSDLHIGNHDGRKTGLAWAARVNRLEPDLVAVTGDLVTTGTLFYEDAASVIGALRGKDGVFVSMGNHDQSNPDELTRRIQAYGPTVLRNASSIVRRGPVELVVAGIDDRMTGKDDLALTLSGRREGAPTVLLSHYPEFFGEAAERGVDLVLSGHTHGGQIAMPFAPRRVSLSRLARQPAHGLHVRGKSRLFVNAGLGTTGPPVRLGIPPEIVVLVLRRVDA